MNPNRLRSVAFMACSEEDFPALVREVLRMDPGGRWTFVCFYAPPVPLPADAEVIRSRSSIGTATRLWISSAVEPSRLVVCCHDLREQTALQPLLLFVSVSRARERLLLDRNGNRATLEAAGPATITTMAVVPLLLAFATVVTRIGLSVWRGDSPPGPLDPARGRTAVLVPILPDLSHTFVYREVLALKQRRPEYLVLALEEGDRSVVHREAAELLQVTEFVPRLSPSAYLLAYLGSWFRRPRRTAALVRLFARNSGAFGPGARAGDDLCFLRLEYLQHSNYVTVGFMLAEFLRRRDVTYVHVYGATTPSVRMLVAHQLLGIPYSVSTYVDFDYSTPFHMLAEKFRDARFVVTCTEFCAARLGRRLPDLASRFRVLHHSLPRDYAMAPRLRSADGRSRLVFIGRYVPKKGIDTLIRACGILRDASVSATCHLYGAGPEEGLLRTLVDELGLRQTVAFHPPVPNQDFYTTMNRDDLFVCPARYMADGERDGIPVTLLEAMAAGLTVVATRVSGIPELIEDGRNGYLVEPDDPALLASVLRSLLTDERRRHAVSEAARRTVAEEFSLENAGAKLSDWISRETASGGGTFARETDLADERV